MAPSPTCPELQSGQGWAAQQHRKPSALRGALCTPPEMQRPRWLAPTRRCARRPRDIRRPVRVQARHSRTPLEAARPWASAQHTCQGRPSLEPQVVCVP